MASIEEVSHRCSTSDCVSGVTNAIRAKDGRLVGEHCRRHVHAALKAQNERERGQTVVASAMVTGSAAR
jgi:hypothetical protein